MDCCRLYVFVFIAIFVFLFLYSTRTKLPRFNYFTIIDTPLWLFTHTASVAESLKVAVVLSNLLLRLLHLTVDGSLSIYRTCRWSGIRFWLSVSGVTSYVSMQPSVATVWQSPKPRTQHRLSPRSRGTPSNFIFKLRLTLLTVETLSCFAVKTAWFYLQLFCHNTLAS